MSYENVTIYLRAPLFTLTGDAAHVPHNGVIIEGAIVDDKANPVVKVARFRDERGRVVSEKEVVLIVPWGKIDHVLVTAPK
jgi:hypothetical protein